MSPAGNDQIISGASRIGARYPVWLCDVWGVVHNGVDVFAGAVEALQKFRAGGGTAILLTNAPRPADSVRGQLDRLGVPNSSFDAIVTSGDVMRELLNARPGAAMFHLGPERDLPLFEDLPLERSAEADADIVVCSGLFDDETETPDDYDTLLERLARRRLALYCANPDRVVRRGDKLVYCAGALAERYADHGGEVIMAGKPFPTIYARAAEIARQLRSSPIEPRDMLVIGDGIPTDMKGAADNNLDALFIIGGIHAHETGKSGRAGDQRPRIVQRLRTELPTLKLCGVLEMLKW